VRVVTNLSTGRLGAALARALAARGDEVTLLATRGVADVAGVRRVPFGTAAELDRAIDGVLAEGPVDLVYMAAAVSDWAPVPHEGKLASNGDELVLRLRPVVKILPTLRGRCGSAATLVGFKLLSGAKDDVLVAAARRQIRACRLDLCVANDLRRIGDRHPVWLVSASEARQVDGTKDEVAAEIVRATVRR
jgi:phosphopantothenoylcysteine decarboxylase/phosphopantothenate--cysteine ligase